MASDIDVVFGRVAERSNVPADQLEQAKQFVRTIVVPALESLRPELEAAGRLVTIVPAIEAGRPTDRDVVYSSIDVRHCERREIEYRLCLRLSAGGTSLFAEEISWF